MKKACMFLAVLTAAAVVGVGAFAQGAAGAGQALPVVCTENERGVSFSYTMDAPLPYLGEAISDELAQKAKESAFAGELLYTEVCGGWEEMQSLSGLPLLENPVLAGLSPNIDQNSALKVQSRASGSLQSVSCDLYGFAEEDVRLRVALHAVALPAQSDIEAQTVTLSQAGKGLTVEESSCQTEAGFPVTLVTVYEEGGACRQGYAVFASGGVQYLLEVAPANLKESGDCVPSFMQKVLDGFALPNS